MAIDTAMYGAPLAAGTYTVGDVVPLSNIRGPSVVRDGYGTAYLKRIVCGLTSALSTANIKGHVVVKNSNWVDEVANMALGPTAISLAENSSNIQKGHDAPLVPNSGWQVSYVVDETVTTTTATDVYVLIDVDYPSVQAVQNPREAKGTPASMVRNDTITVTGYGGITSAPWVTYNIDVLKAGWKYLLVEAGIYASGAALGFMSISGAAGQAGLERIIPTVASNFDKLRYLLDYSTPLVKGPMNLNYMAIGTAGSSTAITELDWVKNTR